MWNVTVKFHSDIINSKEITGQKPFFSNTNKGNNSVKMEGILPIPLITDNNIWRNSMNKYSVYGSKMVSLDGKTHTKWYSIIPRHLYCFHTENAISKYDKCASVLSNILNKFRKSDKMLGKPRKLSLFTNLFNKFNNHVESSIYWLFFKFPFDKFVSLFRSM